MTHGTLRAAAVYIRRCPLHACTYIRPDYFVEAHEATCLVTAVIYNPVLQDVTAVATSFHRGRAPRYRPVELANSGSGVRPAPEVQPR